MNITGALSSLRKTNAAAAKAKQEKAEKEAREKAEKEAAEERERIEKVEKEAKMRADLEEIATKVSTVPVKSKPVKAAARIVPFHEVKGTPSRFEIEFNKKDLAKHTQMYNEAVEEAKKIEETILKMRDTDFEGFLDIFLESPYYKNINNSLFLEFVNNANLLSLAEEFLTSIKKTDFYKKIQSSYFSTNDSDEEVLSKSLETALDHILESIFEGEFYKAKQKFTTFSNAIDLKMKILILQRFPGEDRSDRDFGDAIDALVTSKKPIRTTYDELDTAIERYRDEHKPMLFLLFKINVIIYFLKFKRLISTKDEAYALLKEMVSGNTTLYGVIIDTNDFFGHDRENFKELEIVPNTDKPFMPSVETTKIDDILDEGIEKYASSLERIHDDYTTDAHIRIAANQFHKLFQKGFYKRVQAITDQGELKELIDDINEHAGFDEYKRRVKEFEDLYKKIEIKRKHPEILTIAKANEMINSLSESYKRIHSLYPTMMKSFVECKIISLKISEGITVHTVDSIIEILKDESSNYMEDSLFVNPYKESSQKHSQKHSELVPVEVRDHIMSPIKTELLKHVPSVRASEIFRTMLSHGVYAKFEDPEGGPSTVEVENIMKHIDILSLLMEYRTLSREYTDMNAHPAKLEDLEEVEKLKTVAHNLTSCILRLMAAYVYCEILAIYIAKGFMVKSAEGIHSIMIDSLEDIGNPKFLRLYSLERIQTLKFASIPRPTNSPTIDYARLHEQLNRLKTLETRIYEENISENESKVMKVCLTVKQRCKTKPEMLNQLNEFKSGLAHDEVNYEKDVDKYKELIGSELIPSSATIAKAEDFFRTTLKKSMKRLMGFSAIAAYMIYKYAYWGEADPTYKKLVALANENCPVMNILQVNWFSKIFNVGNQAIDRPEWSLKTDRVGKTDAKLQAVGEKSGRFNGTYMSLNREWKSEDGFPNGRKPFIYTRPRLRPATEYQFKIGKTIKKSFRKTKKRGGKKKHTLSIGFRKRKIKK